VTNENKREYLNALAQYRLATRVRTQVDAFLKGLNDVVPDELLSIFDENELEVTIILIYISFSYFLAYILLMANLFCSY